MPVAGHAFADDGAVEHVERREQGRGAVALMPVLCRSSSRSGGRRNFLRKSSRRIVTDKGGIIVATLGGKTNL